MLWPRRRLHARPRGGATLSVAQPALAVPGLVAVTVTSAETGSEPFKGVAAYCPAGTKILGGGADVMGGGHSVRIAGINPAPILVNPNALWATAHEDLLGYGGSWSLRAWAICAPAPAGWEIVLADHAEPAGSPFSIATAQCPAGKKVIGAGGRSTGKVNVFLTSVDIAADLSSVSVDVTGIDGASPTAYAYAICVNPLPGQQRVALYTRFASTDRTMSLSCPGGTKVHGVGGGLTAPAGQAYLDELGPSGASLTGAALDAREDADGTTDTWSTRLYAVCAD